MKKFLTVLCLLLFASASYAEISNLPAKKFNNMPEGTFKKQKNGTIVQYDKNGKKIGKYKLDNGRYYRLK